MLTRSFPTVLTVRTYVRRAKGQPVHPARALAGATASFAVVAALGLVGMVPRSSVLLASGLLLRAIIFLTALRPAWSAKQLGQSEAMIGILYVSGITFGYHFGF